MAGFGKDPLLLLTNLEGARDSRRMASTAYGSSPLLLTASKGSQGGCIEI